MQNNFLAHGSFLWNGGGVPWSFSPSSCGFLLLPRGAEGTSWRTFAEGEPGAFRARHGPKGRPGLGVTNRKFEQKPCF